MFAYWGTGTKLYGNRDKNPSDGSYVATKWITIFFLPIIPLGSYRVWKIEDGKEITATPVYVHTKTQLRMKKVKLNWGQIFKTYIVGILAFIIALLIQYIFDLF